MARVGLKGDAPPRTHGPSLATMFESALGSDAGIDPRSHTEGDTLFGIIREHLGLSNMGSSEVDAEVAERTIRSAHHTQRQHTAVKNEVGPAAIKRESVKALYGNTHRTVGMLVVIRDVIFLVHCPFGIEMIASRCKAHRHRLACSLGLHLLQHLSHERSHISLRTGHNAIHTCFIHTSGLHAPRQQGTHTHHNQSFHTIYLFII